MAIFPVFIIIFWGLTSNNLPTFLEEYSSTNKELVTCRYDIPYSGNIYNNNQTRCILRKEHRTAILPAATLFKYPKKVYWNSTEHPNYDYNQWRFDPIYRY